MYSGNHLSNATKSDGDALSKDETKNANREE